MSEEDWEELISHLRFELARYKIDLNCAHRVRIDGERKVKQYERIINWLTGIRKGKG